MGGVSRTRDQELYETDRTQVPQGDDGPVEDSRGLGIPACVPVNPKKTKCSRKEDCKQICSYQPAEDSYERWRCTFNGGSRNGGGTCIIDLLPIPPTRQAAVARASVRME